MRARSSLIRVCVMLLFATGCADSTAPVDWGFGIGGRWTGETSTASLVVDIATVQKTCSTGFDGVVSCGGIAGITGTIRTALGQTAMRGAAHVSEGADTPVAIYIIAQNPVEQGSGGCWMDSYDYWAWPSHGDMSGELVIFCSSAGVHGNPSSRTETVTLRRN